MKALLQIQEALKVENIKIHYFLKRECSMTILLLLWLQKNHYQQEQDKRAIILAQVV